MADIQIRELNHRFKIEPVSDARLKMLEKRKNQPDGTIEPLPEHIKARVRRIDEDDHTELLKTDEEQYWLPKPVPNVNYFLLARGYQARMLHKYQCEGFIAIDSGDVVVDCGAYVGALSLAAHGLTNKVFAIEPTPINFECLTRNIQGTSIQTFNCGLFNVPGELEFNVGENSTDNSLIALDSHDQTGSVRAEVLTLDGFMQKIGENKIDFLKVEAEGVELEILEHAEPSCVKKIAIDASEERFGQSPFLDIAVLLANKGYRLASRNYWLYAKAPDLAT